MVGATGAVGTLKGSGINSVTRLSVGTYKITLEDSYYRYLGGNVGFVAPLTGGNVSGGSFVATTSYVITALGNTTQAQWVAAGLDANVLAQVGVPFVATGIGAGTGTVKAVGTSGILSTEVIGNTELTIGAQQGKTNGTIIFQCLSDADAVADPSAGSICVFQIFVRNSSVKGKGE